MVEGIWCEKVVFCDPDDIESSGTSASGLETGNLASRVKKGKFSQEASFTVLAANVGKLIINRTSKVQRQIR